MHIHFICHGNLFRSIIAETYLKSLNLHDVTVFSSGTAVDWDDESERVIFGNTKALLKRHSLDKHAKAVPEQLNQDRIDRCDLVVFVSRVVQDEARLIVQVPGNSVCWQVTDIGEGSRVDPQKIREYEDEIFREITQNVDSLVIAQNL